MFANNPFGRRQSSSVNGGSSNDSGVEESSVAISNITEFEDNPDISTQSPARRRAVRTAIDDEFSVDAASGISSPRINPTFQSISSSQDTPPTKNNKGLNVFLGLRSPSLSKQFSSKRKSEPALLSTRNVQPPLLPEIQDDGAGEARTRRLFIPQAKSVSAENLRADESDKDVTTYNLAEDNRPTTLLNNLRRKSRPRDSSSVSACRGDDIHMESIRSKDSTGAHSSSSMRQFIFIRRMLRCLEYASWTILAIIIQFVFGMDWAFPDGPSCPLEEEYLTLLPKKNASMCFLMTSLSNVVSTWRFLAVFIVAGFVTYSIQNSKEKREQYTSLLRNTRHLLSTIGTLLRNDQQKKIFARWTILAFELSILDARGHLDSNKGRRYLQGLNLLHGTEWDMMIPEDRQSTVWSWILMQGNALNRDEEMTDFAHQKILDASWDCLRSSHDLMGRTTRDLPAPYIRACTAAINLHLLFETLHAGFYWAILQKETNGEIWFQPGMYLSIFYLLSYTSIFSLLFDVYSDVYNPFGSRKYDINCDANSILLRQLAISMVHIELPTLDTTSASFDVMTRDVDVEGKIARSLERRQRRTSLLNPRSLR